MKRFAAVGAVAATVAVLWAGLAAQQEVQSRPGPGSGVMNVNVINHPAVTAAQSGRWQVSLEEGAVMTAARPYFVRQNTAYTIKWDTGDTEIVTIVELGNGGWMQVQSAARRRWINLENARWVEEAR